MSSNTEFRNYILDQLSAMGAFETKNMFGGTALLRNGSAFAKIKHGTLWLKVAENNINDFIEKGMTQYPYGKDNNRKLNFYDAPGEVLEEPEMLIQWTKKAIEAANSS